MCLARPCAYEQRGMSANRISQKKWRTHDRWSILLGKNSSCGGPPSTVRHKWRAPLLRAREANPRADGTGCFHGASPPNPTPLPRLCLSRSPSQYPAELLPSRTSRAECEERASARPLCKGAAGCRFTARPPRSSAGDFPGPLQSSMMPHLRNTRDSYRCTGPTRAKKERPRHVAGH
jgi:hypothetical protein